MHVDLRGLDLNGPAFQARGYRSDFGIDYVATRIAEEHVALGQRDARHWLDEQHDLDDVWQVGPLTPS